MKKCRIITAMLMVVCLAALLMGCGAKRYSFKPEATSVFFTADGRVKEALFDTLDKDYLNQDGLKAFVEEEIAKYNEGMESEPVTLASFEGDKDKAKVLLEYATFGDYEAFNYNAGQVQDIRTAKMDKLSDSEISLEGDFIKTKDKKAVDLAEVQKYTKGYAVTGRADSDGDVVVYTEGKIVYVSSNITEVEKNMAKVPAGEDFTIIYE